MATPICQHVQYGGFHAKLSEAWVVATHTIWPAKPKIFILTARKYMLTPILDQLKLKKKLREK
jgi:hypothetical protein